jgi:hypothetical protein
MKKDCCKHANHVEKHAYLENSAESRKFGGAAPSKMQHKYNS